MLPFRTVRAQREHEVSKVCSRALQHAHPLRGAQRPRDERRLSSLAGGLGGVEGGHEHWERVTRDSAEANRVAMAPSGRATAAVTRVLSAFGFAGAHSISAPPDTEHVPAAGTGAETLCIFGET